MGSPDASSRVLRRVSRLARQGLPVLRLAARRTLGRRSPFQMTLSLTNRCNFKCEYCDIPLQRRDEMDTAEWLSAIDELRDAGMGRASLIGGEPLLRDDAGAIIEHLVRRGVHAAMNTNGWFVEERIDEVSKLDLVCVTLDGPREVHDGQRRRGSYDRAIGAIEALRRRAVPVVTMTVLTPRGADAVDHVLGVASDLGFKAFFQLEHDKGCDVDAPIAPRLADERIGRVARRLLDAKDRGAAVGNSRELLARHAEGRRYLGGCDGCWAGRYYGYVLSDGTVAPCLLTQWQAEPGNGRRHGFARAFERLEAPRGPGCACLPTHEVNRVLDLDPRALWHAVDVSLGAAGPGSSP
jgi:MoaA/NifB/PqqE/SkfB family radical SAM enzyme